MNEYEDSDSSDDDVCFGKYSIEEAKKDLKKYVPKKVGRRHTYNISKLPDNLPSKEENSVSAKHFAEEDDLKYSSEYITANESMSTDRSSQKSEFLERLNKVINEPFSEVSYKTALDKTNIIENTNNQCHDTFLENTVISTEDSLTKTYDNEEQKDESCCSKEIDGSIISISDESLSHVKNSEYEILRSEDPKIVSKIILNGENESGNVLAKEPNGNFGNNNITSIESPKGHINFSVDDSTNQHLESQKYYFLHDESDVSKSNKGFDSLNISESNSELENDSCNVQHEDSLKYLSDGQDPAKKLFFDLTLSHPEPTQKFGRIIDNCNQLSKISEKTEFTSCIEDHGMIKQDEETVRASLPKNISYSDRCTNSNVKRKYIKDPENSPTAELFAIYPSSNSEMEKKSNVSDEWPCTTPEDNGQVGIVSNPSVGSPAQTSEILLEHDDSCQFDDTLEEINRLLEQGIDYEMPEIKASKVASIQDPFSPNDIISGSFMNASLNNTNLTNNPSKKNAVERHIHLHSKVKIKPPVDVKRPMVTTVKSKYQQEPTCQPYLFAAKSPIAKRAEKLVGESGFKVPVNPVKKLLTPSKIPSLALKNVVSPVGVYIKHSPKYHPMIRVRQKAGNHHGNIAKLVMPDSTSGKENTPCSSNEIPKVIYKPSKNRKIKDEKEIVLPGSIKKLIYEQVVTKHEQRIHDDEGNRSIERRLMESDLSLNLSQNQDVSILTNKQPFSIRKF